MTNPQPTREKEDFAFWCLAGESLAGRRTAAVAAVHGGRKSNFCPEFYNIYNKILEISWGLRIRDQFGLVKPCFAGNGPDKTRWEERSRSKHVPRLEAAGNGVDRWSLVSTSCQGEQLRFAPIEAPFAREEAGDMTTSTRRADRHLAFVERWPETRRGRRSGATPCLREEEERKREKERRRWV
ncbi:hypothetical protein JCGZ_01515 [Jatropha curcas]|uniref:Uncharacterized protein n=1 Tax=Jatropha curcas TaxID=180498 RepID=A0A067LK03_JATCU|nr:hypothetical protein JCGZ_01515 [Jatropha curcas]